MKKTILALSVVFGLCAAGADVHAQEEPARAKSAAGKRGGKLSQQTQAGLMKICAADITSFCKGVEPGPKLGKCLLENEDELEPACLDELKKMSSGKKGGGKGGKGGANPEVEAALNKSCKADLDKFCKDAHPGPERGQCLMGHETELSAECGKTLKSLPPPGGEGGKSGGGAALMKACWADMNKFCKDLPPGPQRGRCLKEHEGELSAECAKTFKNMPPPTDEGGGEAGQGRQGQGRGGQERPGQGKGGQRKGVPGRNGPGEAGEQSPGGH